MKTVSPLRVQLTRQIAVSPERLFEAWLDAERVASWIFGSGPRSDTRVRLELDPSVGTFALIVLRHGREIEYFVEVLAIDAPRRLVFTWTTAKCLPDRDLVTVDFVPNASGCSLKLTDELPRDCADHAEGTKDAWTRALDALAASMSR